MLRGGGDDLLLLWPAMVEGMRESSIDRWAAKVGCGRCVLGALGGQRGSVTRDLAYT